MCLDRAGVRDNVCLMELLFSWLILSVAVWVTAAILPGFHVKSFGGAIFVAALFGIFNLLLGWLFFTVLTIATLGLALLFAFLTRWLINAIMLMIVSAATDHLKVDNFGWALLGALLMSGVGTGAQWLLMSVLG